MLCPVCLSYGVSKDAVTTVGGTGYCAQHGVEALATVVSARGNRPMMPGMPAAAVQFTPPPETLSPALADPPPAG